MQNKHFTRLFIILIFAFLSSGAYLLLPDNPKNTTIKPIVKEQIKPLVSNDDITVELKKPPTSKTEPRQNVTTTKQPLIENAKEAPSSTSNAEIENPIQTTISIENQSYKIPVAEKSTVYDVMQKLASEQKITVTMKDFSGMGYFVEEINGTKNDNQLGKYWIYYINGQAAKIGISSYILKNNDSITWKYENSKF